MAGEYRVLILGDVVGRSGCRALFIGLRGLIRDCRAVFVVANAENASDGFGLTPELAGKIGESGVDVITTGNHIWQRREILPMLNDDARLLRPENYPKGAPGHGWCVVERSGVRFGVLSLQGRNGMYPIDCPFQTALTAIRAMQEKCDVILVDFHAEDTAEKEALAHYLDGKVACVVGTHTHVQTADECLLPGGTAYITDLGMTGPSNSVIGSDPDVSIRRVLTQLPLKSEVSDAPAVMCGVVLTFAVVGHRCIHIERIRKPSAV